MKKSKSMLIRILFGRTMIIAILVLLQVAVLFASFDWLYKYTRILSEGYIVISLITVIYILNKREDTSFKLVWMIPVLAFPVFGTLFYIFVQLNPGVRQSQRRLLQLREETKPYRVQNDAVLLQLEECNSREAGLASYLNDHCGFPVYGNTEIEYFSEGMLYFQALKESLRKAEKFILMEYFFIDEGVMWGDILNILKDKAAHGVEVRVLYDGTTPISGVPFGYYKKLKEYGIKARVFMPIRPALSTVQNNRDHRKITVIDGHIAFTGGINLGDEYINVEQRFGHWKDVGVRMTGEAAESFAAMFYEMWNAQQGDEDHLSRRVFGMDVQSNPVNPEQGFIIPYSDSPLDDEKVGEYVYIDILSTAKNYVHIMTPYLILDSDMISSLSYAAKRGVETIIIMPHIPDKKTAYLLARSYYGELIDAGVRIFEFKPGFVHAKVFVSDDIKATVGTINLDYRSLYLHFECGAYFSGGPVVADIERDYQETLAQCVEITSDDCRRFGIFKKIVGRVLRIFAPLM